MAFDTRRWRDSMVVKMVWMGFLILVLLVPLSMVDGVVTERKARHDEVVCEVTSVWGGPQRLGGPVLVVPYLRHSEDADGTEVTTQAQAYFLPETLDVVGDLRPQRRSRGIYEVVVYRAELAWSGRFRRPDLAGWHVRPADVLWDDAFLSIGVSELHSVHRVVSLRWAGKSLRLGPGGGVEGLWAAGLRVPLRGLGSGSAGDLYAFDYGMELDASSTLQLLPVGEQTTVTLRSSWPDPSFVGAFLPESRQIGPRGFQARWSIPHFGRAYPQQWTSEEAEKVVPKDAVDGSAFGVALLLPVDMYQKTERSLKYGALFLVLTFLTFFLYELWNPIRLHPIQSLLVGAALCVFYLLLLSISEHLRFGLAYAIAAIATVGLIGGYSAAILHGRWRALLLTGILGLLYGYLYVLLQAEDFALLLGSVGLFAILALVMFLTRRIDWSSPRRGREQPAAAATAGDAGSGAFP